MIIYDLVKRKLQAKQNEKKKTSPDPQMKNTFAQRGARTHDPEIKSLMLYRLS